jgi:hypothetical protein
MTSAVSRTSGQRLNDRVVSELAAYFDILRGHEEELLAAVRRFTDVVRELDPEDGIRIGLRDTRHVIFDDGRRLLWYTAFEGEWDSYVEDAFLIIGVERFLDWMRHTAQGAEILACMPPAGGVKKSDMDGAEPEGTAYKSSTQLKAILQSVQTQAAAHFNPLDPLTLPQIIKAYRLEQAFRQVLDNPAADEALRHPALRPLLREARLIRGPGVGYLPRHDPLPCHRMAASSIPRQLHQLASSFAPGLMSRRHSVVVIIAEHRPRWTRP